MLLGAHDLGMNFAACRPRLLTNDSYGQINLQMANRIELVGSQHEHSTGAHVQSGQEFLEMFAVGIDAARKKRKGNWEARALAEFHNLLGAHRCIVVVKGRPPLLTKWDTSGQRVRL